MSEQNPAENKEGEYQGNHARSIRSVRLKNQQNSHQETNHPTNNLNERNRTNSLLTRTGIGAIGIIVLLFVFMLGSILFAKAEISVSPYQETFSVNETVSLGDSDIGLEYISLSETGQREVTATGEEFKEERAQGEIIIFNDYSEEAQPLIPNTRFESPEGLIFRIQEGITVPGQSRNDDSELTPGQISVTIYAAEPGPEYNIEAARFTIPGLQGDPRYDAFWAESETSFTGGISATVPVATQEDESQAHETIESELTQSLPELANSQIPSGFYVLEDLIEVEYRQLPNDSQDDQVLVRGQLNARIPVLPEDKLIDIVSSDEVSDDANYQVINSDDLSLGLITDEDTENSMQLSGEITVEGEIDENDLKQEIAGVKESAINRVMQRFPEVESYEVTLRPFWKTRFPEDPTEIDLLIKKDL